MAFENIHLKVNSLCKAAVGLNNDCELRNDLRKLAEFGLIRLCINRFIFTSKKLKFIEKEMCVCDIRVIKI